MAATVHTIHALDRAEAFEVNGWKPLAGNRSIDYAEQAHSVVSFIAGTADEDALSTINPAVTAGMMRAIETLISLSLLAAKNEKQAA